MKGKKYYWLKDKRSKELVIGMLEQDINCYGDYSVWFITECNYNTTTIGYRYTLEEVKEKYKLIKRIPFPNEKIK